MTESRRRPTETFRRQHAELTQAAIELLGLATADGDCAPLRSKLNQFTGKLKVHTAMEEQELYPRLQEHRDAEVRRVANRFLDSFGDYYREYFAFHDQWKGPRAIEDDRAAFAADLQRILARLGARMNQENDELYSLADRLQAGS